MTKKTDSDRFLEGANRSMMTEKRDDYCRLAGDPIVMTVNQPLRVLFLDMDGVMISNTAQRDLDRYQSDRAKYGHAVTIDRSARLALDFLLQLTGARVCLATGWAWHTFRGVTPGVPGFNDVTPGLGLAIERLQLELEQWFDWKSVFEPARHRDKFFARMQRHPRHDDKGLLIRETLASAEERGLKVESWALVDDDFGGVLFDNMKGRGIVKVDGYVGLDVPAALAAAREMGVGIGQQDLEKARSLQKQWRTLRDEDDLWAYDTEKIDNV